ncbi:MAG: methyltransferase domain-containing protein [bacterium]|nr:methyltransferase domain-containing protein [bacterium]
MQYKFIFGNSPELAQAELDAVGTDKTPEELIKILGGTVKIVEVLPENAILTDIIKGDFGISDLTGKVNIVQLCKSIKEETGKRFVLPQKDHVLSSVVVKKQKLTEIIIGDGWMGKTIAVQDFEDWGKRDYGRPEVEGHIGMLPPKVARMMVNLAQANSILDPFCGTGTVLMEALTIGLKAVGSDINPKQVERTRKNLEWLGQKVDLYCHDATKISEKVSNIDAIVTETDLGPRDNLEQLYINCFEDWTKVLKPGGKVVIALPFVKNVIDKAQTIGYTLVGGPYIYARPQAVVKRHICVLKYGTY